MSSKYALVVDYLINRLPMYQRTGKPAYKSGLENAIKLDDYFQHPHKKYKTIHVAGTNGKGSVCHMLAAVLQQAGYRVGLHTSPHMLDFRERIKVNGQPCSRVYVTDFIKKHKEIIETIKPSFFEISVFMAFEYFSLKKVDVAIIETGLGGRLDTTNIIVPVLSVITSIGKDHTDILGNTFEKIATEKAGIIKTSVPVVIGETHPDTAPVFNAVAQEEHSDIFFADQHYQIDYSLFSTDGFQVFNIKKEGRTYLPNLKIELLGTYQRKNIITLIQAIDILRDKGFAIAEIDIYHGLKKIIEHTDFMGRWQIVGHNPLFLLDSAHNADGITEVVQQLQNMPHEQLHLIISFVKDKDVQSILKLLPKNGHYYFTRSSVPRSMNEDELMLLGKQCGLSGNSYDSVEKALQDTKRNAGRNDIIIITGSMFLIADYLALQKK
jgi:dihydrofolate synthase/folylpolyglutamate synthase